MTREIPAIIVIYYLGMGQEFIISATESKNLKKENREIPSRMSLENCGF